MVCGVQHYFQQYFTLPNDNSAQTILYLFLLTLHKVSPCKTFWLYLCSWIYPLTYVCGFFLFFSKCESNTSLSEPRPLWQSYICIGQGLQEKFCKAEQDCFGAPGTGWDFSENWGFELKIHKKWENQNKTSMAKAMGSFRDSRAPYWLSGSRTDVPAEPGAHWTPLS